MWPKLLLEFLPHLSRLIPAADTYLNSRKESDRALQAALSSVTDEVHTGFAKTAEAQSALRNELNAYASRSTELVAEVARVRGVADGLETRLISVEKRLAATARLVWGIFALLVVVVVLLFLRTGH